MIFATVVLVLMAFSFSSCGKNDDNYNGGNNGNNNGWNYDDDDDDNGENNGSGGNSSTIGVPTGLSANVSGSQIRVSWNYASGASSYRIYRSSSSYGSYSLLGSSYNTYYYDDSPLSENYYKVTSVGSNGSEGGMSTYAYCHFDNGGSGGGGNATTAPDAPTGVSAYNAGSTAVPNIQISWNSVSNATSYKVYRSTSASSGYSQIGSETSSTYFYDSNPKNGNNYYKVKAFNSAGGSSYSGYALFNFDANGYEPCPPSITGSVSGSIITLRWSFPTSSGCGAPTSIEVDVYDYSINTTVTVQLSGSATTFSNVLDTSWADPSGWILMRVVGKNSHGSDSKSIKYNINTHQWIGG